MAEALEAEAIQVGVDPHVLVVPELELAEKMILAACASQVPAVSLGAAHVMRAGGKRLRPLIVILVARLCGLQEVERPARLGAAVELIHTASLVHDDVVDESDRRRGHETVNVFFGNEASVLMGDYLVCRALRMIAEEPDLLLMREICDVIVSMCEAEVLQIAYRGDIENTFDNYLHVIRNKTACLFSFAARASARVARASNFTIERLGVFGMNLGMAFQIVDDILDLLGKEQELGKPIACDLREGKFTYPVLHAISCARGEERSELLSLLGNTVALTNLQVERVIEIVKDTGGFQSAYDTAIAYGDQAMSALVPLPDGPARRGLQSLVGRVIQRHF